ncbi:MAG TPA: IS66 family transposase [Gemmataceae bacterium]|jgi:transposase|nr:IS66 family transposase [Gemmataceae bacterium]
MDAPTLPPELLADLPPAVVAYIRWLEGRVAQLDARVADLEAKLNRNSTNSSRPPSADPPGVKRAPPKPKSGKRAGGQPGHPKHDRALVDRPDLVRDCKPSACRRCRRPLAGDDPEPLRHQVTELPPVVPVVTEYRRHRLTCPGCGTATCGPLPAGVAGQDGPRLRAACTLLTGAFRLSKAKAARLLGDLFGVPLSAAQVCATEAAVGGQLAPVTAALLTAAREHPANVDETGMGKGRWLWVMVTAVATVFRIAGGRSRAAFTDLVGAAYHRVLTTDRYPAYDHLPDWRHQVCWAHLRRDFQAMIDRKDAGSAAGEGLLALSDELFALWRRVRDGTLTYGRFGGKMHAERAFRARFRTALERGAACGCAKTAGTCRELLDREVSLYVFAFHPGVEPTNNAAERAVRHGVLWRKQSGGPRSAAGAAYLANIWSVVETCRQHGRNVWEFLTACVEAADHGRTLPDLLPARAQAA